MSKHLNNRVSVAELIQLFEAAPNQAYEKLISSSHYFYTKQSDDFWNKYVHLDHESLVKQHPNSISIFNQVNWLKLFYDLKKLYEVEKLKSIKSILSLNPDETSLTKALFLCLELGDTTPQPSSFPKYTEESLESVKISLREILPRLKKSNQTSYSLELVEFSNNLIKIQIDLSLIIEFLDAFVWANFEMAQKKDSKGFVLSLSDGKPKTENPFILNYLKTVVKRDFKRKESHPKISEEEHFKKIDPKLKTHEGLAGVFYNSGVIVTEQTPGLTSLQVDDSFFEGFQSEDPAKREKSILKSMLLQQEQNFHYQFRQALSQIYQPNDEIDIHTLQLEVKSDVFVSLFDLICVMSCLIAKADSFRYFSEYPNGSIKAIKRSIIEYIKQQQSEITNEVIQQSANVSIIKDLTEFESRKNVHTFIFTEHENILSWLRSIEELKQKSESELNAMIDLLSDLDSPLPFNPLYRIDDKYYFSYTSCGHRFNLNRLLYDNYVSDKLFNPYKKPQDKQTVIDSIQKSREISFTNSLKELFKPLTPFVEAGLDYSKPQPQYEFGDLRGEFDVIAYFEKENIIFPIQVKLSNVSPRTEKRKEEWILNRITTKGINQVVKDTKLLQTKSGLKFIADKLKIKTEIKKPFIFPLIITDNFFVDHVPFPYNGNNQVFCISYFELKHLLLNQKVHDKQLDWLPFESGNIASQLIEAIEKNIFWSFLSEDAKNFNFNKSLCAINEEFKIQMTV